MLFCAFQSTPPRGRRHHGLSHFVPSLTISIHASAREVTGFLSRFSWNLVISIHASAREATPVCRSPAALCRIFQSTPPRGRRQYSLTSSGVGGAFQSTPPRGRRPVARSIRRIPIHFNPRLREGGDFDELLNSKGASEISIHASAREATV